MIKIPTLFVRSTENPCLVTQTITPGCEWVLDGVGTPTVKKDGTNVKIAVLAAYGGFVRAYKRRNPTREEKAQGAEPGYIDCDPDDPANQHIWAAIGATDFGDWPDGAWPCEALGPRIQGGAEGVEPGLYSFSWNPTLIPALVRTVMPEASVWGYLKEFLIDYPMEGIVWHHPDGRMAKIKRRDFGLPWPLKGE